MTVHLRPVDPEGDGDLIHQWVTAPRARFWGMTERTREEVVEIYGYIAAQEHLSAEMIMLGEEPVGIFQTYDPFVDEIGEHYPRRAGDLGVHLFLADSPARFGETAAIVAHLIDLTFEDPEVHRMVLEPDVENTASLALLRRLGATVGELTTLPDKTAQFAYLLRPPRRRL